MLKQREAKPKPRPVGRPRLHDRAKSSIVPVRFSPEERKRVEMAALSNHQTVSEWIRTIIGAALESE